MFLPVSKTDIAIIVVYPKDYFTVACLIVWPLNDHEAGVDSVLNKTSLLFLHKFLLISMTDSIINIRKAGRFLSKQGQNRSKAR